MSRLDFKEHEFKSPCPSCGDTIFRYRDGIDLPIDMKGDTGTDDRSESKKAVPLKNKIMAIALVVGFFGGMLALMAYKPAVKPVVNLALMPKLETSADAHGAPMPAPANSAPTTATSTKSPDSAMSGVRKIEIADLTAEVIGKGDNATAHLHLKLINHGDPKTPYPDLRLKWRGSTAKDIVISSQQYAHPSGPFTEFEIETELHKPPHAKGVDIDLNESN